MYRRHLPSLLLILLVAAVFFQVHSFDYVRFDDDRLIIENANVSSGISVENFLWAIDPASTENWHPLTWFSLQLDAQLFGHSPATYHLSNVFFHIVNTILLYYWLLQVTGKTFRSFLVAALFGIHPLHVESVAWMSERKDTLSVMFGLITLMCYTKYVQTSSGKWYRISVFTFLCSLLSKQMLVTMPFLLLLLDYWPYLRFQAEKTGKNQKSSNTKQKKKVATAQKESSKDDFNSKKLIKEKIPFLVLTVIFSAITFLVQKSGGAVFSFERFSLPARILNAIAVYAIYLKQMIWPVELSFFYPHPQDNYQVEYIFLGMVLLSGVSLYAWIRRDRVPYLFTGWFWYLGTLVPVIGLVQIGVQQMADRYTYFPMIGIFIAIVWLIGEMLEGVKPLQKTAGVVSVGLVLLLAYQAHRQVGYWQNSFTLFNHALELDENNTVARNNLGTTYLSVNEPKKAFEQFRKVVEIDPDNVSALNNLGLLYAQFGQPQKSLEYNTLALQYDPDNYFAHNNLANILSNAGRYDDAIYHYEEALRIRPDYSEALSNYANLLQIKGDLDKAEELLRKAIKISPKYASAYNNLGNTLQKKERYEEAVELYQKAIELEPNELNYYLNLSKAYEALSKNELAVETMKDGLKIASQKIQVQLLLLDLYLRNDQLDQAEELIAQLEKEKNPISTVKVFKARIAAQRENWEEALNILNELVSQNPNAPDLHNELGEVLLKKGDKQNAREKFEKAIDLNPKYQKAIDNLKSLE